MSRAMTRAVLGRVLLVAVLWLLGGGIGLVAGAAFVVYDLVSRPTPRDLLVIAMLLLGLVPLVVLARGLPTPTAIGPGIVEGNLVAHYLAGAGLALLVVGVLREVRSEAPGVGDEPGGALGEDGRDRGAGGAAAPALPAPAPAPPPPRWEERR
jgi:hypothetical protein